MSSPEMVVEPHALRRLAADAERTSGARNRAAERVRTAAPDHTMFGLYGEPLVATLRRFLDEHSSVLQQAARTWESHADGVQTHLRDCALAEDAVREHFAALAVKARA